jgi:hypothetical protein
MRRSIRLCLTASLCLLVAVIAALALSPGQALAISPTLEPLFVWVAPTSTEAAAVFSVRDGRASAPIGKPSDPIPTQSAASDGLHLCAAQHLTTADGERVSVLWGDTAGAISATVTLDPAITPGSLQTAFVYKQHCYLGASSARTIDIDFSASPPKVTVFEAPPEASGSAFKSVDVFLVSADNATLLAVDDVITPFFVFVFKLAPSGAITYQHTISLGPDINGHYHWGFVNGDAVGLLSTSTHRGGQGQALSWYRLSQFTSPQAPTPGVDPTYARLESWSHIGEHAAWDAKTAEGLLAGPAFSTLRAGAITGGRLWLAAAERGVLSAPWDQTKGAGPIAASNVKGSCIDLTVRSGELWILRDTDGTKEAVHVAWDAATERLTDIKTIPLPPTAEKFLD